MLPSTLPPRARTGDPVGAYGRGRERPAPAWTGRLRRPRDERDVHVVARSDTSTSMAMGTQALASYCPHARRDRHLAAGGRRHTVGQGLLVGSADGCASGSALLPCLPSAARRPELARSALRMRRLAY